MNNKLKYLQKKMREQQLPALLVFDQVNIAYLTGFRGHASTLLVTTEHAYFITDYRYHQQIKSLLQYAHKVLSIICRDRDRQTLGDLLKQIISDLKLTQIGFESEHISVYQWRVLNQEIKSTNFISVEHFVEALRYQKDLQEIDNIRQAAAIADKALHNILELIKPGASERELAIELEYQMKQLGSEEPAFDTILLSGHRSALPHGLPTDKRLATGEIVLIDFGAVVNGYRSDMTRTFVLGNANQKQKLVFETVAQAQQEAIERLSENMQGDVLFQVSQRILSNSPFAKYQGEGLGHGVGLNLHELPFIKKECSHKIKPGCVITIEPGIYIPGWGGVRIEDIIAVTSGANETLTQFPKDIFEI